MNVDQSIRIGMDQWEVVLSETAVLSCATVRWTIVVGGSEKVPAARRTPAFTRAVVLVATSATSD